MIIFSFFIILINLYLLIGVIFPNLSISVDIKIRRFFNRPPVIILDPSYIRKRNMKWSIGIFLLFQGIIFVSIYILRIF